MTVWIYGLVDPRESERVRYVGLSAWPRQRFKQHLHERGESEKCVWLGDLKAAGIRPVMRILQRTNDHSALEVEREWVLRLASHGLKNAAVPFAARCSFHWKAMFVVPWKWMSNRQQLKSEVKQTKVVDTSWCLVEPDVPDDLVTRLLEAEQRWQAERNFPLG